MNANHNCLYFKQHNYDNLLKIMLLTCTHEEEEKENGDWFDQKNLMMTDDFLGVFKHRYFDYKELDREKIIHSGKQNMQTPLRLSG